MEDYNFGMPQCVRKMQSRVLQITNRRILSVVALVGCIRVACLPPLQDTTYSHNDMQ
jgi:hypothetical protein